MTFTVNIVPIPFLGDIIFCKIGVWFGAYYVVQLVMAREDHEFINTVGVSDR